MPPRASSSHHVLCVNDDETIFVVDIPRSIAAAQSTAQHAIGKVPLSSPPLTTPFNDTEPKSLNAARRVKNLSGATDLRSIYETLCAHAIIFVKDCRSRGEALLSARSTVHTLTEGLRDTMQGTNRVVLPAQRSTNKRSFSNIELDYAPAETQQNADEQLITGIDRSSLAFADITDFLRRLATQTQEIFHMSTKTCEGPIKEDLDIWTGTFTNDIHNPLRMSLSGWSSESPEKYCFRIPPSSAFVLCDSGFSDSLVQSTSSYLYNSPAGSFDMILMDPPWPNRSAARRGSYGVARDWRSAHKLILNLPLSDYVVPGTFIAVWVTNSAKSRESILGPQGLFESLDAQLVEEWLWLKITASGEPILPIEGSWRKPYEVLLIGKVSSTPYDASRTAPVQQRVVVAVPDVHSRKPCLKSLFEELLLENNSDYRALEVFSRYLMAGWLSWGNEVIRDNWEGAWVDAEDHAGNKRPEHLTVP